MPRWLLALCAGLLGIGAGLLYGWVVNPVKFVDTPPSSLRADYRADYVLMVAESFHANQDAALAARRLAIFGGEAPAEIALQALQTGRQAGFAEEDLSLIQDLIRAMQAHAPAPTLPGSAP